MSRVVSQRGAWVGGLEDLKPVSEDFCATLRAWAFFQGQWGLQQV